MQATDMEAAVESLLMKSEPAVSDDTEATQELDAEEEIETEEADDAESAEAETEAGDEAEEEAEDEDEDESEAGSEGRDTYTVKVDGKEVSVTLEDLKRAYSGQSYIQKGMQEAAAKRKEADQLFQALQSEQQRFMETVQRIQSEGFRPAPQRPDPKLAETDPIGFMQANARYDAEMAQYQQQQEQLKAVSASQNALRQKAMQAHLAEQAAILQQSIPEFSDAAKAGEIKSKLLKTGAEYGFGEDELAGVTDARTVQVLYDAMRWRELQSGTAKAKKKPEPPKNLKPRAKRTEPESVVRKKKMEQAKKSGRMEDWVDVLLVSNAK